MPTNEEIRLWYNEQTRRIPELIDTSSSLEEQARQAHALRNRIRTEARKMMEDQNEAAELDRTNPNRSFEALIQEKMEKKGLSLEEAFLDTIQSAKKTNRVVNEMFGLDAKGNLKGR